MMRALRSKRLLILLALAAALIALLVAALPADAASLLTPEKGASPNQEKIRTLYIITGILGLIVLIGVEAVLIYSLIKFRRRRHDPQPVAIHGNAPLEIGWTVGAIVL